MLLHSMRVTILQLKMIILQTVIVALAASLVMAQDDDPCSKYGLDVNLPGASCAHIYDKNPTSRGRSGYYILKTGRAYCDMELDCGGVKGGWMRIADIDTSRGDTCPGEWTEYSSKCMGHTPPGCYSANFSTNSTSYSKVCGKVKGYQKGSMDGFYPFAYGHKCSLGGVYVDGISITSGNPRKHVWTYAVGLTDDENYAEYTCPCAKYPGPSPPTFVGSHYYCESGTSGPTDHARQYFDDPLWDGAGCLPDNNCCSDAGMPWFFRQFPSAITGDLEVRICRDQIFYDEGVLVEQVQLYVQ